MEEIKVKQQKRVNYQEIAGDMLKSILAGMCISLGGIAYLASQNKIVGALFFTVGLFMVLTMSLNLFTGKICYAFDNKPSYLLKCLLVWVGNLIGAVAVGYLLQLTRLDSLQAFVIELANTKLSDTWYSVFILGILCNILIYVAVDGYKNNETALGKYLSVFFGVSIFVLCGFEHCVADMFYFSFAGAWSWHTLLYVVIITLGNVVGGLLFPLCKKLYNKKVV